MPVFDRCSWCLLYFALLFFFLRLIFRGRVIDERTLFAQIKPAIGKMIRPTSSQLPRAQINQPRYPESPETALYTAAIPVAIPAMTAVSTEEISAPETIKTSNAVQKD